TSTPAASRNCFISKTYSFRVLGVRDPLAAGLGWHPSLSTIPITRLYPVSSLGDPSLRRNPTGAPSRGLAEHAPGRAQPRGGPAGREGQSVLLRWLFEILQPLIYPLQRLQQVLDIRSHLPEVCEFAIDPRGHLGDLRGQPSQQRFGGIVRGPVRS